MKKFLVSFILLFFLLIPQKNIQAAEIPLDPDYCGGSDNDYYVIPGEQICSRAPNACGNGYDELNTEAKMPNPGQCMGEGSEGRAQKGCAGYVPLCCYEMARTGDYTKCIGYWERLWCTQSQCLQAASRGASDSQCGGSCQCAHANIAYCGDINPVPIEKRLGLATTPTPTLPPYIGDANGDTHVNILDFEILRLEFGKQGELRADFDKNGRVDSSDLQILKDTFGLY